MSIVVGAAAGIVVWLVSTPLASKFIVRRRRDVAIGVTLSAVLAAIIVEKWAVTWIGVAAVVLVVGYVVLAEIDIACRRLPREISYPLAGVVVLLVTVSAASAGDTQRLVDASLGVLVATSSMLVLYVSSRGGLGDGDVRLAPALGSAAAFGGIGTLWVTMLVSFVSAGVFVVAGLALGRMTRSSAIPFGPFLIGGSIMAILVS